MGHNLQELGTATLDTMGGLITNCNPQDLPEGASPRCFDVDFVVGSVFTRAGLSSVYVYTATLQISAVSVGSAGLATFTYTGKQPSINEGFFLEGFSGQSSFLNGTEILIINSSLTTFTAQVGGIAFAQSGLSATANSTIGNFVGPNAPTVATMISSSGNVWNNPTNILGDTGYASVTTGTETTVNQTPTQAANTNTGLVWSNPNSLIATGVVNLATVTLTADTSVNLIGYGTTFSLPANATVTGIAISAAGKCSVSGVGSLNIQLANANTLQGVGTAVNVPLSTVLTTRVSGSSAYQWGTTLTPTMVNGSEFGILVNGSVTSGTATISANSLEVTVYYTTASGSEELQTTVFSFSVVLSSGVSGIGATFQAYSSAASTVTVQLMSNGVAVGTPKTQALTTTPTVYSLGAANDLWGAVWSPANVNNTQFGVQITASGFGTTFINDLDALIYVLPQQVNFNYVKSYIQDNDQITTLALDASGLIWEEDVTNNPGVLTLALSGILPGSFANSATGDDQEYIMFSDLTIGTDRPRVYNGQQFLPLSQVGPGAPPSFQASVGSGSGNLLISNYSLTANVVTFTYTGTEPTVGSLYLISGVVSYLNGQTVTVLSTGLSSTQFEAGFQHANDAGGPVTGTATPAFTYGIASITQPASVFFDGQILLWSAGPGQTAPGTTVTCYYASAGAPQNAALVSAFNTGNAVYVYLTGLPTGAPGNDATWLVTSVGAGVPPSETPIVPYFTFTYTSSAYQRYGGPGGTGPNGPGNAGTFQQTLATLTTSTPIPDLSSGEPIVVSGETPTGWNGNWTIVDPLNSGVLNVTSTQMDAAGNATYGYNVQSGVAPTAGELVTVENATNAAIFNATGVISSVAGGTFVISGFPAGAPIAFANESGATATTFGTQFTFDPGAAVVTTDSTSIFGNAGGGGEVTIVGGNLQPVGSGTRQGVVFFITESGYETTMSPPITFTTSADANYIQASKIPIGPPNVIARGIAFTEAGQNGVPGANFYVIRNPVIITVGNVTTTYSSTVINDNTSTTAKFTFTDAVLLDSDEVDIQGNDLFNLIELGSSAWCVPYASRMFYGLQLNKIDNWTTGGGLTFDSGYLPNPNGNILPVGWSAQLTANEATLIASQVTGMSYYVKDTIAGITPTLGMIFQTAYQDPYQVAIIEPNTTYSVRVAASCPGGVQVGNLVIDLTDYNPSIGFGKTYGSFIVPLSSMVTTTTVFTGTLLTNEFTSGVSGQLQIRVWFQNMGFGADCEIDRIEVFPTAEPYLKAQVYGSYINDLEAIDASGSGGIVDTSTENQQPCMGGFVMHDTLFLLKQNSWYATEDNPNSEPGGWSLREISNKVGACGINAYDVGEEWCVTACRQGIFGFNGGQPVKIMQELWNLWNLIYWESGATIWIRNDITNKRILCGIPLPTGTNPSTGTATATVQWLPFAEYNPTPTTPNVILMLNYQGMATFDELISSPEVHTTMFGALAAVDMKRKWAIWQIASPYAAFINRQDVLDDPLFICNGIDSSKIYQFLDTQYSDDGEPINSLYTTYGFVNATKAATLPIFGFHAKRYTVFQSAIFGGQTNTTSSGNAQIRMLPNTISPTYPYTVPVGIPLSNPVQDDFFRPINVKGNRMFVEISTDAVGSWFNLSKMLLTGKADAWSTLPATGGGNAGVVS